MKVIVEKVNECVVEYILKVNEKKSKVCINSKVGRHKCMMGDCCIGKVEEYKYLGITVEGGKHGDFKSTGDRMKEANGQIGMVPAEERSGSKYVIGREGWNLEDNDWRNGFGINEREQQYVHIKSQQKMRNMQMAVWERE